MSYLIWTPEALQDVQHVYRFLALKNISAAKRALKTIRQSVKVLEQQPNMGRPVQDMDDEFRDWIIDFGDSGYVARYRVDRQFIVILALWHQKEAGL